MRLTRRRRTGGGDALAQRRVAARASGRGAHRPLEAGRDARSTDGSRRACSASCFARIPFACIAGFAFIRCGRFLCFCGSRAFRRVAGAAGAEEPRLLTACRVFKLPASPHRRRRLHASRRPASASALNRRPRLSTVGQIADLFSPPLKSAWSYLTGGLFSELPGISEISTAFAGFEPRLSTARRMTTQSWVSYDSLRMLMLGRRAWPWLSATLAQARLADGRDSKH